MANQDVSVLQIGEIPFLASAVLTANQCQTLFKFRPPHRIDVPPDCRRENETFWLLSHLAKVAGEMELPTPVLAFTSLPIGEESTPTIVDEELLLDQTFDGAISVASTYLLDETQRANPQCFVLNSAATLLLAGPTEMGWHSESRGCVMDTCNDLQQMASYLLSERFLCASCLEHALSSVRAGRLSLDWIAATRRLFFRAGSRRCAFVAMPFAKKNQWLYDDVIRPVLLRDGWCVERADEYSYPRLITDAIKLGIMSSNLVIADLSGLNPNVLYEVGLADGFGRDLLFIVPGKRRIPFDLSARRTLFYSVDGDRETLKRSLADLTGHRGL